MNKLIEIILPMYANQVVNKIVLKKIDNRTEQQESSNENLSNIMEIEVYKEQYFDTFKIKDKLEDKAKTNVVGVTIAITLIMGASGVINTIYGRFPIPIIKWIAFSLLSAAVMYMIAAGLLAIKVLIKDNKMFYVNMETFASGNQALSEEYNECIYLNKLQNTMRNNSIFTSYECIRNSLVSLFLILMLVSVPIINPLNPGTQDPLLNAGYSGQYQFLYSAQAVNFIKSNDIQSLAEDIIIGDLNGDNRKAKPDNEFGIADIPNKIFIKYSYNGSTVNVLLIEAISNSTNP